MLTPTQKAWRFLRLLAQPKLARKLGTLVTDGYLAETGWVRSVAENAIVDARGMPMPWATYPFVEFIGSRLAAVSSVFEYGAGASTLYYARRVQTVIAVEDNPAFADKLRPSLPANVTLLVSDLGSQAYVDAIARCDAGPDLVSVDGNDRVRCVAAAWPRLNHRGVVVLDDAERPEYADAHTQLRTAGFRAVEFWGLAPDAVRQKCTTIFYRRDNVLDL